MSGKKGPTVFWK